MQPTWKIKAWRELRSPEERAALKGRVQHLVQNLARRMIQSGVALAVDQVESAIYTFGLGRYGVRLSGRNDIYEATLPGASSVTMAEAAERLSARALADVFSQTSERALILNLAIRWLQPQAVGTAALMRLTWSAIEREQFRREVLSRQIDGAELHMTAPVLSEDGLCIAEVEMVWKAWARRQISREGER